MAGIPRSDSRGSIEALQRWDCAQKVHHDGTPIHSTSKSLLSTNMYLSTNSTSPGRSTSHMILFYEDVLTTSSSSVRGSPSASIITPPNALSHLCKQNIQNTSPLCFPSMATNYQPIFTLSSSNHDPLTYCITLHLRSNVNQDHPQLSRWKCTQGLYVPISELSSSAYIFVIVGFKNT